MNKITLITGASAGLGKELAKLFLRDGNSVLLVASRLERLQNTKEELLSINKDYNIDLFATDLSTNEGCKALCDYVDEKEYFVNYLVNNAGIGYREDLVEYNIENHIKLNNLNVNAVVYLTSAFSRAMVKNNEGHILNISSIAAYTYGPYMATYHASKAYVQNFSISVSREFKGTNVKMSIFCPGCFTSEFCERANHQYTFSKVKPASSKEMAEYAYKYMNKGKLIIVPGKGCKAIYHFIKFAPLKKSLDVSAAQIKDLKK